MGLVSVKEVIKNFFNFDLSHWGIEFKVWHYPSEVFTDKWHSETKYAGLVPDEYNELYCSQVEFDSGDNTITFYCSENDEDF